MNILIAQTNLIYPKEVFFTYKQLTNNNPLDRDFIDYEKLKKSGIDEQQALKKLQMRTVTPSGLDSCNYLQETWQKNGMTVFKVFFNGTTTRVLSQPRKQYKK